MALEPIKWKSKIILVKPEVTYGVDPTPTGAANAMLMTDVQLQPMEGEDVARNLELPYLGGQEQVSTGLRVVLTGSFELVGSGSTGVPPGWAALMRACGVAQVVTPDTVPGDGTGTVDYVPVSDAHESVALHFHIGPTRHIILGARGTAVFTIGAQGIPTGRVTITGLFVRPADQARPAVTLTGFQTPQVATKNNTPTFTIGAIPFILRTFTLDLGNDVQPRLLIGVERILIVDRTETITANVEAVPMATYNPYAVAEDLTRQAVVIQHGTVAGKRVRIEASQAQQRRLSGFEQNQNITEWPLAFSPLPTSAGNNQWKITLT